jgi:hypothetical protein
MRRAPPPGLPEPPPEASGEAAEAHAELAWDAWRNR